MPKKQTTKDSEEDFIPEPKIPESEEISEVPVEDTRNRKVEHKVIHNDNSGTDAVLVGYSEPRDLPDESLVDEAELLGHHYEEEDARAEPQKYQTAVMNSTMGSNLLIYPAVMAGRCAMCGTTRFVDRRNGTKGEVWKVVSRKTGEHHHSYKRGEWVEVHAANCPHYRNVDIRCSYCNEGFTGTKDKKGSFTETIASRILWVFAERNRPNDLIMVCSDFRCKNKFDTQYHINHTL